MSTQRFTSEAELPACDAFGRFERFLVGADPRAEIIYHIGDLGVEAEHDAALRCLRALVWSAYADGRVALVQRRAPAGGFAYVAQRCRALGWRCT